MSSELRCLSCYGLILEKQEQFDFEEEPCCKHFASHFPKKKFLVSFCPSCQSSLKLGDQTLSNHTNIQTGVFHLAKDQIHLNNGSFGTIPRWVFNERTRLDLLSETRVDDFIRRKVPDLRNKALEAASRFINAPKTDLVFVDNATTGINCVLQTHIQSLLGRGDSLTIFSTIYPGVRFTVQHITSLKEIAVTELQVKLPIHSPKEIVQLLADHLETAQPKPKCVVVDHIASSTALVFPLKEIIDLCHKHNTLVVVDGAHTFNHIPVDIQNLNPDYYCTNVHKWGFAPRGCALLYVKPEHQKYVHPLVCGNSYHGSFQDQFFWQGTKNDNNCLSLNMAIEFISVFGQDQIRNHNHELAVRWGKLLAEAWNVEQLVGDEALIGNMVIVSLPKAFQKEGITYHDAEKLWTYIFDKYHIEPFINVYNGVILTRLSMTLYVCEKQIEKFRDVILEIAKTFDWKTLN